MKTTVYVGTSLDGFIARKDGDIGWLMQFNNKEVQQSYDEFISKIDAIVIGRGTFEAVLDFPSWPYDRKVFVLSNSINQAPDPVKDKVTVVSMSPSEMLAYLSDEGFSNIYIDGGKVIQSFLKEDLIDELIITQVLLLIGSGIPLFGDTSRDVPFIHLRTEVYSNQLVKSYYQRNRK